MSSLQPWNNIPKATNSKTIKYNKRESIDFNNKTTYLPRGLGRSYGDVCLNNEGTLILTDNYKSIINFDHEYGICFPQIIIRYIRSYFSKNNLRITIDKKISFSSYKKSLKNVFFYNFDDYDCAEIKCQNLEEIENLNLNHFLTVRNSKYCIGMNHILKNSDIYSEPL